MSNSKHTRIHQMKHAPEINLTDEEREILQKKIRRTTAPYREVSRIRIILEAADGLKNKEIAKKLNTNIDTVGKWRKRFAEYRFSGLHDAPRPGRAPIYGDGKVEEVVKTTIEQNPENRTHWSTRSMAERTGVGRTKVSEIWRAHEIKPHLERTFKLSNDKHFIEKLHDIVGLYMAPPDNAIVLCVDEKSQIQALDRTQPGLPLWPGRNGTRTHDYVRHGTCCLFAALNVLTGEVLARCEKRHRHQEYLRFLRHIDKSVPKEFDLHLVVDNYCTHKHHKVKAWLEKHPRFHVHFIPTSASWLNMIERFFGKITEDRIRRGTFKSILELSNAIYDYIDAHNEDPKPFIWTKSAEEIIAKLEPVYKILDKPMN